MNHLEFHEAGYRFFGIKGVTNGMCDCENPHCTALFKHPWYKNWQHTPAWSDEQLEAMELGGQLEHGYGVIVSDGLLVVDVDARNGGVASYKKLVDKHPNILGSGLIVQTGSGNGSKHLYFTVPIGTALMQHHPDYPGLDFKSSGFCVGPGSKHMSGSRYTILSGSPYDIGPAPEDLIDLLKKPEVYRAAYDGKTLDLTDAQIVDMLSYLSPNVSHEVWIKVGMSVHHATGGSGLALWDTWSRPGEKYPGHDVLERRWHSFGKSANPVTIGTLIHYAKIAGWSESVTFDAGDEFAHVDTPEDGLDTTGVDLLRPPGFVGELTQWLNTQGISARNHLAVATALTAVGNIAGLHYSEDLTDISLNVFCFCVAGSGSGKEAMLSGFGKIHIAAGLGAAVHGNFKSEQELISNIIHHQAAYYAVDEVGTVLSKVQNASKNGGAVYLDGLVGQLMSIFSKANGNFLLTGDRKREVKNELIKEHARIAKKVDENEDPTGSYAKRLPKIIAQLEDVDSKGIVKPFLSMIGFTTPDTFNKLVTPDFVKNGFMARALFFEEPDNNPKPKGFLRPPPMPESIKNTIAQLASGGFYESGSGRIEFTGEKSLIHTDGDAKNLLHKVSDYFWELGEQYKESNGFESITRRGYELTSKVSAILAAPGGIRTVEHVTWAFALVKKDMNEKALLAFSNDDGRVDGDRLMTKILTRISKDHGETVPVLHNRIKSSSRKEIEKTLIEMEKRGLVEKKEVKNYRHTSEKWFRTE